jgi:signal recognition particle receptor subunit beta
MQDQVVTIRTLDCDICEKYDSIRLTLEEISIRANSTDIGIGAYSIIHADHTRIIYFDDKGSYLGDTIALNQGEIPDNLETQHLPFYITNTQRRTWFTNIRKSLFSRVHSKNLTISIAGPSQAGKTSFVRYLETLTPERNSIIQVSVPTMGKSTKRIKLGRTTIKTLDMGGQQDFWDLWSDSIKSSDMVIFILDGTSNNMLEVAKAFERVIQYRLKEIPVLVIINKKDLCLRGEAPHFVSSGEFLALTTLKLPVPNVMAIEASIFEGLAYKKTDFEEIPLVETINSFLDEYS